MMGLHYLFVVDTLIPMGCLAIFVGGTDGLLDDTWITSVLVMRGSSSFLWIKWAVIATRKQTKASGRLKTAPGVLCSTRFIIPQSRYVEDTMTVNSRAALNTQPWRVSLKPRFSIQLATKTLCNKLTTTTSPGGTYPIPWWWNSKDRIKSVKPFSRWSI